MSYLVLDIETYPDTTVWTPPKAEPLTTEANGKKPRSRKKNPEDVFPPLYAHRPIAIGYAILNDDLKVEQLACAGTSIYGDDEARLLNDFAMFMNQLPATVVTFRGRGFDLPVLALRAFRHGVQQGWYTRDHRYRYSETHHIDLFEALTESGAIQAISDFKLDTFCQILGLPGKNGVDGSKVKGLFDAKEIAKIEGYCTCDVARTAFVLMRYFLMRGRITLDTYRSSASALFQLCVDRNLGGVTFSANTKQLLLEA